MKFNYCKICKHICKHQKFIKIATIVLLLLGSVFSYYRLTIDSYIQSELELTDQEIIKYLNSDDNYAIPQNIQQMWVKDFKSRFFSPWNDPFQLTLEKEILEVEKYVASKYIQKPGWGMNKQKIQPEFFENISKNMDLTEEFNTKKPAITTRITSLRLLPTDLPSFTNWTDPGEGYPFDNMQTTSLHLNLPIFVLQTTKDKIWSLVLTPNKSYGWVKNNDLVFVEKEFIDEWTNGQFIVASKERTPLLHNNQFQGIIRIGNLHPLYKETSNNYIIKLAFKDKNNTASIQESTISKDKAEPWPIPAKTKYIASIANEYLGQPYGWGGFMELHDCSSTLMDLFANFAIWLPKYSGDQIYEGKYVDLTNLSDKEKERIIKEQGRPFFTLLWRPGHIVLYIGHDNNDIYIFHTIWGLRTRTIIGKDGRVVLGKTVITSIKIGDNNPAIKETLLAGFTGMILIDEKPETKD